MGKSLENFDVVTVGPESVQHENLPVITEVPLDIVINGHELLTMLCTPVNLKELVVGFLWGEGLLNSREDIKSLELTPDNKALVKLPEKNMEDEERWLHPSITSGCGRGTVFYSTSNLSRIKPRDFDITLPADVIYPRAQELIRSASLYNMAGAIHCTGLANRERVLFAFEDIGRHNAADKVIGKILLEEIDTGDKIMLTTGRMTSEITAKAARGGVPILASLSGPSHLAVEAACYYNMTMIGYVRKDNLLIYSHPERIVYSGDSPK
jgi:FdhD protein